MSVYATYVCVFVKIPNQTSEPLKHAIEFIIQTVWKFSLADSIKQVTGEKYQKDAAW